jgi:hypothetical protein
MKFYETHFEDYCKSAEKFQETALRSGQDNGAIVNGTIVPSAAEPDPPQNWIVYGPSGVGKYTRTLTLLKPYSPSQLKYDKKVKAATEKQSYIYRISDIHYEVDMSLLGCNAKIIWHDIYKQIVDIVTIKPEKLGFIVCKNFHAIHNELLDIFYSYMQQHCYERDDVHHPGVVQIYFILITEHVSFLPSNIVDHCQLLRVPRPRRNDMLAFSGIYKDKDAAKVASVLSTVGTDDVINLKEVYSFALVAPPHHELPQDHFNMVCDTIIQEMHTLIGRIRGVGAEGASPSVASPPTSLTYFRDCLYDILIYNLDGIECVWYIFRHFAVSGHLIPGSPPMQRLLYKLTVILKQYGNNYRSIFHLENAVFSILEAATATS